MSNTLTGDAFLAGTTATKPRRWIESIRFDALFFILGPLLIVPIAYGLEQRVSRLLIIGFLLGFPHYFSSLSFYFWDERRDYYRRRWLAFYAGPVILGVIYGLLIYFQVPIIVQFVLFFWNAFHVARQSCGILSIYRHGAGVHDTRHRDAANFAIISVSIWMALWNITTHREVFPVFAAVHPKFPLAIWLISAAIALFGVGWLVKSMLERVREGKSPDYPEVAFLLTSIALFHPYLWMKDSAMATFCMLLPHYVQYMGIVWLMHRRKFAEAPAAAAASTPRMSFAQSVLVKLSNNAGLLVAVLFSIGAAFYVGSVLSRRNGFFSEFEILYLFIAFQHFYLDGLFWAFKQPEIRSSLSPFLMRRPDAALATS